MTVLRLILPAVRSICLKTINAFSVGFDKFWPEKPNWALESSFPLLFFSNFQAEINSKLEQLKEKENKIKILQNRVEELQKAGVEKKEISFSVVNLSLLQGWEIAYFFPRWIKLGLALIWWTSASLLILGNFVLQSLKCSLLLPYGSTLGKSTYERYCCLSHLSNNMLLFLLK